MHFGKLHQSGGTSRNSEERDRDEVGGGRGEKPGNQATYPGREEGLELGARKMHSYTSEIASNQTFSGIVPLFHSYSCC